MKTKYFQGRAILEPKINELLLAGRPRDLLTIDLTFWNRENAVPIHIEDVLETAYDLWEKYTLPKTAISPDIWADETDIKTVESLVPKEFLSLPFDASQLINPEDLNFLGITIVDRYVFAPPAHKYRFIYQSIDKDRQFNTFLPPYRYFEIAMALGATVIGKNLDLPENINVKEWDQTLIREIKKCEKNFDKVRKMLTGADKCMMLSELYYLNGHPAFKKPNSNDFSNFSQN